MSRLIEVATVILAGLVLLVGIGISIGLSLLFLGFIWLGVASVWGMIF